MLTSQQSTRMQDHLQATLLTQLSKKPLEKITTGDLALAAKVDRSTFYRYYHNKFELLAAALKQSVAPYVTKDEPMTMMAAFNQLIYWVDDNRKIVKNIVANNASFNFYQEIIRLVTDLMKGEDAAYQCEPQGDPISEMINHSPNPEFAIEAVATSLVGIMMTWLNHPEMDVDAMQAYLNYSICPQLNIR